MQKIQQTQYLDKIETDMRNIFKETLISFKQNSLDETLFQIVIEDFLSMNQIQALKTIGYDTFSINAREFGKLGIGIRKRKNL